MWIMIETDDKAVRYYNTEMFSEILVNDVGISFEKSSGARVFQGICSIKRIKSNAQDYKKKEEITKENILEMFEEYIY